MKKVFGALAVALSCLAIAMPADAQLLKFGVKGGVNMSEVTFRNIKDNSTGFYIGPMAELTIPLAGLGVDAAVLYDQRGDHDYKQQAFDIPVNLKYTIGLGSMLAFYLAAGPDFYFDLKKEKNGAFALLLTFAVFDVLGAWLGGSGSVNIPLAAAAAASGVAYVALTVMKHHTRWLDEEGR